jgi:hypothetical protein
VKHGAKNSQLLMGIENTMYKGKSLHVHRNNKNRNSENHKGTHTHCFLIHLNKEINKSIKNRQIHGLTPKGQSSFFSKLPFQAQEAQTFFLNFFAFLTVRSCLGLLGEHVQKVLQKLNAQIGKKSFFSLCLGGKEDAHFFQKNKFLVITFEWIVRFG